MEELRFDGQVVVVTGAGRGLGRCHALMLASRGARVLVNDRGGGSTVTDHERDPSVADAVAEEIRSFGGEAIAHTGDVADDADEIVASAVERWGRLDALVNNAGIAGVGAFPERSPMHFEAMLRVHLFGSVNMTRAAWPHLVEHQGRVVNTASGAFVGLPEHTDYASAKGAVVGFTRAAAIDGRGVGIRVNAVMPVAFTRLFDTAGGERGGSAEELFSEAMKPEYVSPMETWLAHQSVPCSGEVFESAGGHGSRMMVAFGPVRPAHTPEEIADAADAWVNDVPVSVPADLHEQLGARFLLTSATDPTS